MIDLRKSSQYYKGFYIYKNNNCYHVGKNGTSIHTTIEKLNKDIDRMLIIEYIYKNCN